MSNRSTTALIALRRILRVTELNARKLAQQSEVTASQLLLLQFIGQEGRALPSSIARGIELKQATVTVLTKKLEESGLVSRHRDTDDRRRVWIELTAAGRALLDNSPDLLQHRFEQAFRQLAPWEQSMIVTTLERVAAMLDAEDIDASPVLDVGDLDRLVEEAERADRQ